ncbi:N-acetylmuramoyl-L-alanine amidase [Nibrella saemangeumensis]|uniref:N-acetylmuramoyl-L-alanine amidase n=1 Tax=Nibrella saemangeumensis TaxID=1084526 RepID=A0ABP8NSB3_9BACT
MKKSRLFLFIALTFLCGNGNTANSQSAYGMGVKPVRKAVRPMTPARKPAGPEMLTVPMFGPGNARVAVKSNQLRGAVYYLSPGHGGPDPGAVGQYGRFALAEDEYAYDVTLRLARTLMEHGARVYMMVQDRNDGIREDAVLLMDKDEVTYPNLRIPLNQTARLRQRVQAVNRLHAQHRKAYQRLLIIHVDSRSKNQNIDVFFYHHEKSAAGKKLAKNLQRTFTSRYQRNQPGRGYVGSVSTRGSLYEVRNSHPSSVFIELGNIRSEKDQRRFVIADNRQALANWICQGVIQDFKGR